MSDRIRTLFIRLDTDPRDGRADVAHVHVVSIADGSSAYVGEVSGREDVIDAVHIAYITDADPWAAISDMGYERPDGGGADA